MIRGDLSNRLVHLTRDTAENTADVNFLSIIKSKELRGSIRDIRGGFHCVCLSEAPLGVITQTLKPQENGGMRYKPFGVIVSKSWLFQQGGRPVIYQSHQEYDLLHCDQRYRHVRYDPQNGIDYTWEREWRIRLHKLRLSPEQTTFVVPTRKWEKKFQDDFIQDSALLNSEMGVPISESMPWHFVVLEDLGVQGFED